MAAQPLPAPSTYKDSIRNRITIMRFKSVGHPYNHLDGVGIEAICEHITRGFTLLEVCEAIDLPQSLVRKWIEIRGHEVQLEEATILSAEGYLVEGMRMLRSADTKFALDKAKAIVEQGRWMASKKDRKTYGQTAQELGQAAAVSYTFNIGGNGPVQVNVAPPSVPTHEVQADSPPAIEFGIDFNTDPNAVPLELDRLPSHLQDPHLRLTPAIATLPNPDAEDLTDLVRNL